MHTTSISQSKKPRTTKTRLAVLACLEKAKYPVSISDILNDPTMKNVPIDQVTVYRIIDRLMSEGLVYRLEFQEGKFRYELAQRRHHHHAICTNCGKIIDVTDCLDPTIEEKIKNKTGFVISSHSLEFFGLCPACKKDI